MVKLVVVTGGSLSGLGKGTCASSIGVCLRSQGYRVTAVKIDPYLNVDAGTISPGEHGEVFVLKDGHEGDLDLGNYERALEVSLTKDHNITTGKIYQRVIDAERRGDYLGCTVQVVPHVTDCIQKWIVDVASVPVDKHGGEPDICLVEVGGTVGDIESSVYLEALCHLFAKLKPQDRCLAHLTYLPTVGQEQKTKPSQHSFRALQGAGLKPDFVMARCQTVLGETKRQRLSIFSGVAMENVFSLHDVSSSYLVPKLLIDQHLHEKILRHFNLPLINPNAVTKFIHTPVEVSAMMAHRLQNAIESTKTSPIRVAIVAKYLGSNDTYLSIVKALEHSACEAQLKVQIQWIDAELLTAAPDDDTEHSSKTQWDLLKSCHAILTPGGFGHRGVDGKIAAAQYAREHKVPYLGICYGLHTMLIEGARNLLNLPNATTEEIDPNAEHKVVVYMPETVNQKLGGTMRLGDRPTIIRDKSSLAYQIYDQHPVIHERHRHRYEVNTQYQARLEGVGYAFVGVDDKGVRMEIVEYKDHPFMMGVQYHPEFTSKVSEPNPCFLGLILAANGTLQERLTTNGGYLLSGRSYGLKNIPNQKVSVGTSTSAPASPKAPAVTTVGGEDVGDQENIFADPIKN